VQETIENPAVSAVFDRYSANTRRNLMLLRRLIYEVAYTLPEVGGLVETLKWGQPSYLTNSRSGNTIRIDQVKAGAGEYAMYFNCQTTLVETFRKLCGATFTYEGNRAIIFSEREAIPIEPIKHCIALALTYHLGKKR
jgi:hypothetical protein